MSVPPPPPGGHPNWPTWPGGVRRLSPDEQDVTFTPLTTRGQVTGPVEPCWSSRARSTGSKRPPRAWPTVEPIGQAIGGRPKAGVVLRCPQSRCTARLQSFREQHPPVAAQLHGSAFLIQLQPSLRHGVVEKPVPPAGLWHPTAFEHRISRAQSLGCADDSRGANG